MSLADLQSEYPLIYTHCHPRGGPGWSAILDTLLQKLQQRADFGGTQARALQSREKWGRLSLRFSPLDPDDAPLVAHASELSMQTCEVCGSPGNLIEEAWYRTRCAAQRDVRPTWPT